MSYTIHSIPRPNLPASDTRMVMRAIAGVQDATTFQEARDALLRYYYPVMRIFRREDPTNLDGFKDIEYRASDLVHSGGRNSAVLFCENVWNAKNTLKKEHVEGLMVDILKDLQEQIVAAREAKDATPYERVGRILAWLKKTRTDYKELRWGHSALREWMQGLLTDFTLADAKKSPGAMLRKPEEHYATLLDAWADKKTGHPFDSIWKIAGGSWFTKSAPVSGVEDFAQQSSRATEIAFSLRATLIQETDPALALMMHTELGVVRQTHPSWRDVSDYGVLHSLLTLDETSFNKDVWVDFLQHRGGKWIHPDHETTWHSWQEAAQTSYQAILQAYTGSTLNAIVRSDNDHMQANPVKADARSPLSLNWYNVFSNLACRFVYLNSAPEFEALAKLKMNTTEFEKFQQESQQRVGQPLILSLLELPKELQKKDAFNMPTWFHVRLQEATLEQPRLNLPDNLLDDNQEPSLY